MLIYNDALYEGWLERPDLSIGHGWDKKMSVNVASKLYLHHRDATKMFCVKKSAASTQEGFSNSLIWNGTRKQESRILK